MILWNATLRPNRGCHFVRTFATYVITCSSHGFTNPETTNPGLLFFLLNVLTFFFFDKGYWQFLIYFDSQMKIVLEQIKTNSNFSENKIRIRRRGICGNM